MIAAITVAAPRGEEEAKEEAAALRRATRRIASTAVLRSTTRLNALLRRTATRIERSRSWKRSSPVSRRRLPGLQVLIPILFYLIILIPISQFQSLCH